MQLTQEREDMLDRQSAVYEERLVELHSVIAELSRQAEERAKEQILEEEGADDDDECVSDEEDVEAGAELSMTSTDVMDSEAVEAGQRLIAVGERSQDLRDFLKLSKSLTRSAAFSSPFSAMIT